MLLRKQRNGFQKPWKIEELKVGLEHFYKEHSHYPTATEVDEYEYLPTSRSIERSFGGLVSLRQELQLNENYDFRTGAHSSERAKMINKRAHASERVVYDFLCNQFGREFVHREYFFTDDHRTRADFFIYDAGNGFCVDVFYPNSVRNLTGCLNIKLKKYSVTAHLLPYLIIFLQMNPAIQQERLNTLIESKERKLSQNQKLVEWKTFQKFCRSRKALKSPRR